MPFHGRPSRACSSCRERRIKCDRVEPICSQCRRANKECGGYKDLSSLMFRNENAKAARRSAEAKAKTETRRQLEDAAAPYFEISVPGSRLTCSSPEPLICRHTEQLLALRIAIPPSSPVEEQGLRFFISRFVSATAFTTGGPPHILQLFNHIGGMSNNSLAPARDAVVAVGLAAMSNVNRDRALLILSRKKHTIAIKAVREAVVNLSQANPVVIFHIIVMLALYEMVNCSPGQIDSWTVHLDGVAALLRQPTFTGALTMPDHWAQLQVCFVSIVRYFLSRKGYICPDLLERVSNIMDTAPLDAIPAVKLVEILIRFMVFDASLHQKSHDPRVIVNTALEFESELWQWASNLPERWSFVVKETDKQHEFFHGQYHIYRDSWVSKVFNHYRWARLLVNEMVLCQISSIQDPRPAEFIQRQQTLETISCMGIGICAGAASQEALSQRQASVESLTHVPPLNGVFMLLFPLVVAGGAAGSPIEVHEWVVQTLERIGYSKGIRQALEMIPQVKRTHGQWKVDQEQWESKHVDMIPLEPSK